jgi:predicted metal-dependent hydrolase
MPASNKDFDRGLDLFNRAHFFDAHEVLEDVWRSLPRDLPRRLHVQGIVQLAVAFHHESTGNLVGARSVLERALRNLDGAGHSFPELDLDRLRAELADWQKHFAGSTHRPKLPQIAKRKLAKPKIVKREPKR